MSFLQIGLRDQCPRTPPGLDLFLLSPAPSPTVNMFAMANLKKKMKENEVANKGEVFPQKEPKHQKVAKGQGKASSVESKEDHSVAEVCPPTLMWDPQLELGSAMPRSSPSRSSKKDTLTI